MVVRLLKVDMKAMGIYQYQSVDAPKPETKHAMTGKRFETKLWELAPIRERSIIPLRHPACGQWNIVLEDGAPSSTQPPEVSSTLKKSQKCARYLRHLILHGSFDGASPSLRHS